jgi:penicillin-binding protein 1A
VNPPSERSRFEKSPFREICTRGEVDRKGPSFFGGIARFVLLVLIGCVAGGAGVAIQGYYFFIQDLPSIDKLKNYSPPIVSRFYGSKGELIGEFATERRVVLPIDQIPETLQLAFIAAEDKNFEKHGGVDKEAIVRAVKLAFQKGKVVSGASTITQQVAKNFLLTPEKKYSRKIREVILSVRIERSLTKEQILYLYLNQILLGSAYGVEAAAQAYFGKGVQDLTIAQCAVLGGLAQAPSRDNPRRNLKGCLQRRAYVLERMLKDGHITQAQYEQATQEEVKVTPAQNPYAKIAPDFVEHVRRYVGEKYGWEALNKEGLQVYTTVDLDLTKAAYGAVDGGLRELDKREGYRGPIKTLSVKGVMDFLEEKTHSMEEPLRFGQVTEGVVTHIDNENIYVRMGSYLKGDERKEYVGQIKIDPNPKWFAKRPYLRPEKRTRNFAAGDLPFQVGDLIQVRLLDPNIKRKELYRSKFGKTDPDFKNYKEYTEDMVTNFPLELEQEPLVQSALMLRENRTGSVRVLVGGHSGTGSQYNRAIQARRQAGSSFKPAIYAAALNKGFTCADMILDSPLALTVPGTGEVWRPKNYRGGHQGPVTFRDCLVNSRNIPTIKILQQIGLDYAKAYARKLGYTSPLVNNLTLALGSTGVSLEEQLNSFSVFPNKGYAVPAVYVTKIVDRTGKVLEEHMPPALLDDPAPTDEPGIQRVAHEVRSTFRADGDVPDRSAGPARRVIDDATAYIMTNLLQGVVQEGTATVLKKIVNRPDIAGKTGTTNENVDAWFMGFSPDYTCGVWVGFDDEVSVGEGETGGKAAAPIWGLFMKEVLKDKPVKEFFKPANIELRRIDPRSGLATQGAGGIQEVFKAGSGPVTPEPRLIKGSRWDNYGSDLDQF